MGCVYVSNICLFIMGKVCKLPRKSRGFITTKISPLKLIARYCTLTEWQAYVLVLTILGPEYLGRNFEVIHDSDMDEVAGHETIVKAIHRREAMGMGISESDQED